MRRAPLLVLLILLAFAIAPAPAHAGGIVSVCDEAHLLAALAGGGTVTFACSGTIILTATITIASDTTIDGSGQNVTISGNHAVQVAAVNAGVTLQLNRVTIADGAGKSGQPGGILNSGTLSVSSSAFSGNLAGFDGVGGGIYNADGVVNVTSTSFSGNSATRQGGAIYSSSGGTLTVDGCTFTDNYAIGGGGIFSSGAVTVTDTIFSRNRGSAGGGLNCWGAGQISNSTFTGNSAGFGGAGIYNGGKLTVSNSTFSGNTTTSNGGGIANVSNGALTVINGTFAGNKADAPYGATIDAGSGTVMLKNTIVANSLASRNCSGAVEDGGGNLSYPDTTCPGINNNPMLGPLANWGGPTQTMGLRAGSAALDAANDATCAAVPVNNLDQRGITRPQGPHCDIGAFEGRLLPTFLPVIVR